MVNDNAWVERRICKAGKEIDRAHRIYYVQNVLNDKDREVREKFIDLGGRSAQRLGFARSLGQVYAALYLSPRPLGLQDLMDTLHISKGNASMSVRQLAEWGTVRRIWVKGDRKDFYELKDMRVYLEKSTEELSEEGVFMRQRIYRIESLQKKIGKVLPLLEKFLK